MKCISYIFCFLIVICCTSVQGQEREKLEEQRKKILEEIEFTRTLLEKTSKNKALSIDQLETLERQINLREKVMKNISEDVAVINSHVDETNAIIVALEKDLEKLKEEYATMVNTIYKNRSSINQLIFIFSSSSFNDAFKRMRYIQQLSQFRKRQAELILETKNTLSRKKYDLETKKSEKQKLLDEEKAQREKLSEEKSEKNHIIASLQQEEKQLRADINKKQDTAEKLNKKIEEIIKREIEAAKKKAEEADKKEGNALSSTPEAAKLSADFASNQGKLPWPVDRGIISSTFGEKNHPVLKHVKIINNGIDIKTYDQAPVRSVFEGTVVSVVYNPGFKRAVIIRHGEYFTVYSNLEEVNVRSGDNVSIKQTIGKVHTDEEDTKTDVHFELWKGTQKLNPALWIYSNNP